MLLKQACKRTLRQIGALIGSADANNMFQNHLIEGAALHYCEFINDLSKVIVSVALIVFIVIHDSERLLCAVKTVMNIVSASVVIAISHLAMRSSVRLSDTGIMSK